VELLTRSVEGRATSQWSGTRASLPSGQLEEGATGGSEGGVPLWGAVSASRLYRHESEPAQPAVVRSITSEARRSNGSRKVSRRRIGPGYRAIGFRANEVRLQLSLLAYNLGNLWRRLVLPKRIDAWSLTSLQQRLVKTAADWSSMPAIIGPAGRGISTPATVLGMLRRIWALPMPSASAPLRLQDLERRRKVGAVSGKSISGNKLGATDGQKTSRPPQQSPSDCSGHKSLASRSKEQ